MHAERESIRATALKTRFSFISISPSIICLVDVLVNECTNSSLRRTDPSLLGALGSAREQGGLAL